MFAPGVDLYELMIDINEDTDKENLEHFTVTLELIQQSLPATTTLQHPYTATVFIMDRSGKSNAILWYMLKVLDDYFWFSAFI